MTADSKALAIFERLARENPAVASFSADLANMHSNLALLQKEAGDRKASLKSSRTALAIRERLVQNHPAVVAYRLDLGASHYNLAMLLGDGTPTEECLRCFDRAIQALAADSSVPTARRHLCYAHWNQGRALSKLHRIAEARASLDAAIGFADPEETKEIRAEIEELGREKDVDDEPKKTP